MRRLPGLGVCGAWFDVAWTWVNDAFTNYPSMASPIGVLLTDCDCYPGHIQYLFHLSLPLSKQRSTHIDVSR